MYNANIKRQKTNWFTPLGIIEAVKKVFGGKLKDVNAPKIFKNNSSKYIFFFNLINFFYNRLIDFLFFF